jgi:hypothetical protein
MKKFIFIALFVLIALFGHAQVVGGVTSLVGVTVTNTETDVLVIATPVAIKGQYSVGVLMGGTNVSGTATVTGFIQVSDDNVTWYNYGTAITLNNAGTVSEYAWALESAQFRYYRIKLSSSGTGVTTCTGKILLKNK